VRQSGSCARALCDGDALLQSGLETPHFTLHSSNFTLRIYTSHSTLHLISSHLIWALLTSSQLFSSHLISSHLSSKFLSTAQPEHCSTFLISSKLLSTHLSSSACHKAFTAREKPPAHKNQCTEKLLHTEAWDTGAFTQTSLYAHKPIHTESFCTWQAFTHSMLLHREVLTHSKFSHSKLVDTLSFYRESFYIPVGIRTKPGGSIL